MSRPVIMELLSSEYGWTPDQIRAMNNYDIENYLYIISIKRKIQEINLKK